MTHARPREPFPAHGARAVPLPLRGARARERVSGASEIACMLVRTDLVATGRRSRVEMSGRVRVRRRAGAPQAADRQERAQAVDHGIRLEDPDGHAVPVFVSRPYKPKVMPCTVCGAAQRATKAAGCGYLDDEAAA